MLTVSGPLTQSRSHMTSYVVEEPVMLGTCRKQAHTNTRNVEK